MWTYRLKEGRPQFDAWQVGYCEPTIDHMLEESTWRWKVVEEYNTQEEARSAVHFLNGGNANV